MMRSAEEKRKAGEEEWYVASGYGDGKSPDILLFTADLRGRMEVKDAVVQGDCPSFLCVANGRIFAAGECSDKAAVTSYRIDGQKLYRERRIEFPGAGLCHLAACGQMLYAGCYQSGEWYVIDQKLEHIHYVYRGGTHIHWTECLENGVLLVADLGQDTVLKFSAKDGIPAGEPEKLFMKKGSGPRQVLYDSRNHKVVVINELDSTIAIKTETDGSDICESRKGDVCVPGKKWEPAYRRSTQRSCSGNYPGGAWLSDSGKLFVANRGADTIAAFETAKDLRFLGEWDCHGHWPRYLCGTKSQLIFAACQKSDAIQSFLWREGSLHRADSLSLTGAACISEVAFL